MEKNQLVFTYAYLVKMTPVELPKDIVLMNVPDYLPGYFVGDPNNPCKGNFEGRNNLEWAVWKAAEKSRTLSTLVDMSYEGLAVDERMVLLLQPIQEDPNNYKTVEELAQKYLPKTHTKLRDVSDRNRLKE
ncbi:hypothetical protein HQ545_06270 [Candidatus Woesearchaeota archaeon]|nr:hypothetical protein [Candidatus Woesearchaeota archaeon]